MAFKIKDGVRIGTVDVFNNSGELLVNAPTATKWATARTITLGGDLTGNVSVDGSANVTLTATIAADSVALGTDTTGNYMSGVTGSTGITVTHTPAEGSTATIAIDSTVATLTGIQTLTNKTLTSPTITGVSPVITLGGDLTGSVTLTDLGSATLTATIAANSVALGTDTTGNYIATIAGTTNQVTVTGSGSETAAVTLSLPQDIHTAANPTFAGATLDAVQIGVTAANEIDTSSGNLVIDSAGGTVTIDDNLTVSGNLVVNGTTTTVNSTTTTLDDPIITLGGDTAPTSDDNKDRGVEFRWHNGTTAKLGFFGYDDSTGKFTFIPDATNSSEVFSGTKGELDATVDWSNISGDTTVGSNLVTLTNPGAISFIRINADNTVTALSDVNFRTAIGAGTGNGNGTVTSVGGTGTVAGLTLTGTVTSSGNLTLGGTLSTPVSTINDSTTVGQNLVKLTNPSAIRFIRINADNTVTALSDADMRTALGVGSGSGTVTSIATENGITGGTITTTGTIGLTGQALALHNLSTSGIIARTGSGTVATRTITAGTNITVTNGDGISGNPTISASFTESDTLSTVTARGNQTNQGIQFRDQGGSTDVSIAFATSGTVASTTATQISSFSTTGYRAAKYLVQITQGSAYQISEVLVLHNGTTTNMTEYAVLESGSALGTLTSDISGGNVRLLVTMGSATSATIRISAVLMFI